MAAQHLTTTSKNPMNPPPKLSPPHSTSIEDDILSPGFRSVAAMAGWDEEALISAALVVDDTPVRDSRRKKRRQFISPPSTLPHKNLRRSRGAAPRAVLHLDDSEDEEEVDGKNEICEKGKGEGSGKELACLDRLREELSCAICLDICFEPSTTNCGHSFCKKCLNCAATKCGKRCPKCRQLISYARDCSINTVLWNTIQLLFPEEVEERKKLMPTTGSCTESRNRSPRNNARRSTRVPRETEDYRAGRTGGPSQSEDAALALRLQREEFMDGFRDTHRSQRLTLQARLNAIAARANYIRSRDRH